MAEKESRAKAALSGGSKKSGSKKHGKSGGKKHRTHEMHIRRGASGGYIVRHDLEKEEGPMGPESPEPQEHAIPDIASLHDHLDEHMGDQEEQEQQPAPAPAPAAAA